MFALPGNVTAYTDSPIYARTSGYLTKWYYDIGSHVKKGALLAEIATPELDQQLTQAEADLGPQKRMPRMLIPRPSATRNWRTNAVRSRIQRLSRIRLGNRVGGEVGAG